MRIAEEDERVGFLLIVRSHSLHSRRLSSYNSTALWTLTLTLIDYKSTGITLQGEDLPRLASTCSPLPAVELYQISLQLMKVSRVLLSYSRSREGARCEGDGVGQARARRRRLLGGSC